MDQTGSTVQLEGMAQQADPEVHDCQNEASHDAGESDRAKGKRITVAKQADGHAEVVVRSTLGSWRGASWPPFSIGYHTKGEIAAHVPNGHVLHVIDKHGDSVRVQVPECTIEGYVKVHNVVDYDLERCPTPNSDEGLARSPERGQIEATDKHVMAKQADGHSEVVLRAKPKGKIVGKVPNGQVLQVIGKAGNSIRVRAPRCTIEGYVKAQNVIDGGLECQSNECQPNSSNSLKSLAGEPCEMLFDRSIVDVEDTGRQSKKQHIKDLEMWAAVQSGSINLLRTAITLDGVNNRTLFGRTALHIASSGGFADCMEVLLNAHADVQAQTDAGLTALHVASQRGHSQVVSLLLDWGSKVDDQDNDGNLPLHLGAMSGRASVVTMLIERGGCKQLLTRNSKRQRAVDASMDIRMVELFQNYEDKNAASPIQGSRESSPDVDKYACRTAHDGVLRYNSRFDQVHRLLSRPDSTRNQDAHAQASPRRSERPAFVKLRPSSPRIEFGIDSWKFLSVLGKGSFGEVFLVEHKQTGKEFAMKLLQKRHAGSGNVLRYTLTERNIMCYVSHPYITSLQYAFQTPTVLAMVTDYCSGGNLQKLIETEKRLKEPIAQLYTAEILLALVYLHDRHIVFRDLKPDNTCLDADGHCKLIDFGLAKEGVSPLRGARSFCGSLAFMAPEILRKHGYNQSVDVYGLGVLFFHMLTGFPPFYHHNREQLIQNIKHARLKVPPYVSTSASSLLSALLQREPKDRLGYNDTKVIMDHPYFVGGPGDHLVLQVEIRAVTEDCHLLDGTLKQVLQVYCTSIGGLEVGGAGIALEENVDALDKTIRRHVLTNIARFRDTDGEEQQLQPTVARTRCQLNFFCGEDRVDPEQPLKAYSDLVVKCTRLVDGVPNLIDFDALMRREVTVPTSLLSDPLVFGQRRRHTHPSNPFERKQSAHPALQNHVQDWEYENIAAAPMEEELGFSAL